MSITAKEAREATNSVIQSTKEAEQLEVNKIIEVIDLQIQDFIKKRNFSLELTISLSLTVQQEQSLINHYSDLGYDTRIGSKIGSRYIYLCWAPPTPDIDPILFK